MSWIVVMLLAAVAAAMVQGLTGFGSGIVLMVFLPHILPISQSAGVSTLTMFIGNVIMVWRYRHALNFKRIVPPFIIYAAVAAWSVHLGTVLPVNILKAMLGGLLIVLAVYFTLSRNMHVTHFPIIVSVVFMIISGFFNGLFGIGGPLMALYFLTIAQTKEEYLASIQTFFFMDAIYVTTLRFATNVLSLSDVKFVIVGMIGAMLGTIIANRIVDHLNIERVKQCVYVFIGIAGAYYLLAGLQVW
jgi:uncharacterized membrane protein YfcA